MAKATREQWSAKRVLCERCGSPNRVWFTDNELWNNIARSKGYNVLCLICFIDIAERMIEVTGWKLIPENLRHSRVSRAEKGGRASS